MQVVDEDDNPVEQGEVGEIVIRGHNIMKGYWQRPEATEEAMRGGWFHSGDMARTDEDGYFYIVDRKKDLIIRGGYNVYPREVEEVLYEHPKIREAAVVGIPHDEWGEEIGAAVVLHDGEELAPEEVSAYVKERIAAYKYPRVVWFLDDLPKGPTGKILKREIEPAAAPARRRRRLDLLEPAARTRGSSPEGGQERPIGLQPRSAAPGTRPALAFDVEETGRAFGRHPAAAWLPSQFRATLRPGQCNTKRRRDERRRPEPDGQHQLRGPLPALGARQLERLRHRLLRGPRGLGRAQRHPAPLGDVDLLDVLLRRGPGRRHPRPLHHRRPDRGAVLLPRHPAGRRGPPLGLLPPLLQRGDRRRRLLAAGDARLHPPPAQLGLPRDLRPARRDGRRTDARTARCRSTRRRSPSTT